MSGKFTGSLVLDILFCFLICHSANSQSKNDTLLRLMFYNTENLFDTVDDTLTEDNDFLPEGLMKWNSSRYHRKINAVCKTILAEGEWNPAPVIAFCEIENKKVLEDLIYNTGLSKYNYRIIHKESPDRRGIDVCLIYRKEAVDVLYYTSWIPKELKIKNFNTRSVLYTKITAGSDTLHLILNHWPSRRGGVLAGEELRGLIGLMIREKIDSIVDAALNPPKIIVMGDFNSTADDDEILKLTDSPSENKRLINLTAHLLAGGIGTYRYQGKWEIIDQVMVSESLLKGGKGYYTNFDMIKIFAPAFFMKKDNKYPGFSPYSTYKGYKYQGGFSDHLPVILELGIR